MTEYDEIQAQQILQMAMTKYSDRNQRLSREQLQEIAAELGVNENEFQLAEQEWRKTRLIEQEKQIFALDRRRKFNDSMLKFSLVNATLISLNLLTAHQVTWSVYPLVIWGMVMGLKSWETFQTQSESYNRAFLKWQQKQKRNQLTNIIADRLTDTTIFTLSRLSTWLQNRK
jgi:isopenicillin N synthase-like dioxygenase